MYFVFPNKAWSTNEGGRANVSSVQLNCALIAPCHWVDLPLMGSGHSMQTCVCVCVCVCAPDITLNQLPHLLLLLLHLTPPIKPPSVRPAEPDTRTVRTHAQTHTWTSVCGQTPPLTLARLNFGPQVEALFTFFWRTNQTWECLCVRPSSEAKSKL